MVIFHSYVAVYQRVLQANKWTKINAGNPLVEDLYTGRLPLTVDEQMRFAQNSCPSQFEKEETAWKGLMFLDDRWSTRHTSYMNTNLSSSGSIRSLIIPLCHYPIAFFPWYPILYHICIYIYIYIYIMYIHIISYHIISYQIISYHIISNHIISYHIISYYTSPSFGESTAGMSRRRRWRSVARLGGWAVHPSI